MFASRTLLFVLAFALPTLAFAASDNAEVAAKKLSDSTGITLPVRDVALSSRTEGVITQIPVAEGDKVEANALLVQLDDREQVWTVKEAQVTADSDAEIKSAKALATSAIWLEEHTASAHTKNAASDYEVEQAKGKRLKADADVEVAELKREQAKAKLETEKARLEKFCVKAPFAGIVRKIEVKPGKSVQNNTELLMITVLDPLRAEIHLPATFFETFKKGDECAVNAGAPLNRSLKGKVVFKDPVLDPASGTFRCLIDIPNPELLPAGWTFTLEEPKK